MNDGIDKAYQERFTNGLLKVMIETSIVESDDGQRTSIIRSAEVIDAMVTLAAMLLSTSEATASPTKTRATADEIARKLRRRIAEAKNSRMPFETVQPWMAN